MQIQSGRTVPLKAERKMLHNLKIFKRTVKGPKLEIFGFGIFTQIRPVWIGDLGTNPKNSKSLLYWLENRHFVCFSTVADSAKKNFTE
jgi:hypothetical protein